MTFWARYTLLFVLAAMDAAVEVSSVREGGEEAVLGAVIWEGLDVVDESAGLVSVSLLAPSALDGLLARAGAASLCCARV